MGAGKTTIGRRLAARLDMPFVDADAEIERAAGCPISEIFERYGEQYFRDGERRVIARLLDGPAKVLATGGGAFMASDTRQLILERSWSIWLRAELDVLVDRCGRRGNRPLLQGGDMRRTLNRLIAERYPIYAAADFIVDSDNGPHEVVIETILEYLRRRIAEPAVATMRPG
jgi:shikimate kinase